ncbi:MAG: hypothetical protein WEB06_00545 [Actinomycetota bacterium]
MRDKLTKRFLNDVLRAWQSCGRDALTYLAESDPAVLVQVTAAVVARLDAGPRASPATLDRIAEALERIAALAEGRAGRRDAATSRPDVQDTNPTLASPPLGSAWADEEIVRRHLSKPPKTRSPR